MARRCNKCDCLIIYFRSSDLPKVVRVKSFNSSLLPCILWQRNAAQMMRKIRIKIFAMSWIQSIPHVGRCIANLLYRTVHNFSSGTKFYFSIMSRVLSNVRLLSDGHTWLVILVQWVNWTKIAWYCGRKRNSGKWISRLIVYEVSHVIIIIIKHIT